MRKKLKNIFVLFFALLTVQNFAFSDEMEFAQIGDVHYTLQNTELDRYLYFLSLSLKKTDPDFAVFLGDNVDKSREEDVIGFMRAVYAIKTPYYIVLGKNDAHKLSGIDKELYLDIVTAFNRNQEDGKTYYYFKPNSDIICAVLDDTPDFARSTHGEITDEQVEWLDKLLTKYSKKLFICLFIFITLFYLIINLFNLQLFGIFIQRRLLMKTKYQRMTKKEKKQLKKDIMNSKDKDVLKKLKLSFIFATLGLFCSIYLLIDSYINNRNVIYYVYSISLIIVVVIFLIIYYKNYQRILNNYALKQGNKKKKNK